MSSQPCYGGSQRRDKYFLYPMFLITGLSTLVNFCLVSYAFAVDGTLQRMATIVLYLTASLVVSFLVLLQCIFLYEHYTQTPSFPVLSGGFGLSLFLLWNLLYLWPLGGNLFLAGGALGTLMFSLLGLQAKPGTVFPLVFLPFCSGVCYLSYPAAAKVAGLILVSLRDLAATATAGAT